MKEERIALIYPREPESVKAIIVDLVDVRAADSIRVSFDFKRDGWVIEQASVFEWELPDDALKQGAEKAKEIMDDVCDPDWQEVAFIKAWAREVKG